MTTPINTARLSQLKGELGSIALCDGGTGVPELEAEARIAYYALRELEQATEPYRGDKQ